MKTALDIAQMLTSDTENEDARILPCKLPNSLLGTVTIAIKAVTTKKTTKPRR